MKTKQITLKFNIPTWVPTWSEWRYRVKAAWNTLKFQMNPLTCHDCGVKINFKFPNFTYQGEGKNRVILHQSGSKIEGIKENEGICGHCLAKRIHKVFDNAKPLRGRNASYGNSISNKTGTMKKTCDSCGETKPCLDVCWDPECDIRFGSQWWNGHHICRDCLTEAAEKGSVDSSIGSWFGGYSYKMNEVGAAIPYDGDVRWWKVLLTTNKHTYPVNINHNCAP